MQRLMVYSIHDQAADAYITPFFLPNDDLAKRAFYQCVQDENHQFHKSPQDFCLFKIGEFELITGALEPLKTPISLGPAMSYLAKRNSSTTPAMENTTTKNTASPLNNQMDIEDK